MQDGQGKALLRRGEGVGKGEEVCRNGREGPLGKDGEGGVRQKVLVLRVTNHTCAPLQSFSLCCSLTKALADSLPRTKPADPIAISSTCSQLSCLSPLQASLLCSSLTKALAELVPPAQPAVQTAVRSTCSQLSLALTPATLPALCCSLTKALSWHDLLTVQAGTEGRSIC